MNTSRLTQFLVAYETEDLKTRKYLRKKTTTLQCGLIRKKYQFPRFPSFRFCPIPKIENSEILLSFILLQFFVSI